MKRLHTLDALRGLAALAVVVWHWQHFFALNGDGPDVWQPEQEPFFHILKPLYGAGWMAVDLFFALSGFVFYWLYAEAIRTGQVRAGRFMLLRFSRLYPLHFATLILVAALQWAFQRQTGQFFIFESGYWARFVASLVMAQQWLPPTISQFFNGPSWSVSVEVLLYIVFFAICRMGLRGAVWAMAIALAALTLYDANWFIARGLMGFFLGGVVHHATAAALRRPDWRRIARRVTAGAVFCWALLLAQGYFGVIDNIVRWTVYQQHRQAVLLCAFIFLLAPLTIAALVLREHARGPGPHRMEGVLAFLGDVSYSTYMLHFPLQLACVLAALHFGWTPAAFMQPLAMPAFFAVLIALGAASHYGFEMPVQAALRRRFARARPAA